VCADERLSPASGMGTQPHGSALSSDDQRPSSSWPAADAAPPDGDAGLNRPSLLCVWPVQPALLSLAFCCVARLTLLCICVYRSPPDCPP